MTSVRHPAPRRWLRCAGFALAWLPALCAAVEFRSIAPPAAILYDAPSLKAKRLFILNQSYPVEIVVTLDGWFKVRDAAGGLAWIEAKDLATRKTAMVKVPRADVRKGADENAPVVFQVDQDVLLDVLDVVDNWAHVRHADGAVGYIRITQVWGL
jgi:SH3-like domain-containing protein